MHSVVTLPTLPPRPSFYLGETLYKDIIGKHIYIIINSDACATYTAIVFDNIRKCTTYVIVF